MLHVYHLKTQKVNVHYKNEEANLDKRVTYPSIPYATVAIEFNEDGTVNRGISICSPNDAFVKKEGVNKAVGRLNAAKKHESNIFPIPAYNKIEKKILKKYKSTPKYKTNFKFLGYFKDQPTDVELEIFKEDIKKLKEK